MFYTNKEKSVVKKNTSPTNADVKVAKEKGIDLANSFRNNYEIGFIRKDGLKPIIKFYPQFNDWTLGPNFYAKPAN